MLPRLIGASRAWELMLTGRVIDSAEADSIGLVTRVVPDDELLDSALETAALVAANSPWGVRMTKEVAWSQLEVGSLQAGIDLENRTQILSSFTARSEEHTSELQSLMRNSYAVFCLKKKKETTTIQTEP